MNYLRDLMIRVLQVAAPNGLGKVKLAKIIYFTHKNLVLSGFKSCGDMKFIRMPLGPVPKGFMDFKDPAIIISKQSLAGSFDMQVYSLVVSKRGFNLDEIGSLVNKTVGSLDILSTAKLVEASHKEPSWGQHANGDEYFITREDLLRPLPKSSMPALGDEDLLKQHLQAKLIEGMLDEIVDESTLLEYPNEKTK